MCCLQGDAASGWRHRKLVVAKDLVERLAEKLGVTLQVGHLGLQLRAICDKEWASIKACTTIQNPGHDFRRNGPAVGAT